MTDAVIQEGDPNLGGHNFAGATLEDIIPATCISTGIRGRRCQRDGCGYHTIDLTTAALGHDLPGNWTQTTPANCVDAGLQTRICRRSGCDHSVTQNSPAALRHNLTSWLKNSATTCLEEKRTCTRVISSAACSHFEERTRAATTHNWNGLWPRTGKLEKTCLNKCQGDNICTVKRTLDDEMVQIQGRVMPIDSDTNRRNWGTHTITLSAYKMHKFEVTQDLYEAVMGTNPSIFKFYGGGAVPCREHDMV